MLPLREAHSHFRRCWRLAGSIVAISVVGYGGWLAYVAHHADRTLAMATVELRAGRYAAGRSILQPLLWAFPKHPAANLLMGKLYAKQGDFPASLAWYGRVPVDSPEYRSGQRLAAYTCLRINRVADAEKVLKPFLDRFPEDDAWLELYWLYYNQLRIREAEGLLHQHLTRNPASSALLLHLLNLDLRAPLPREHLSYLNKVNQLQPGQYHVLAATAECQRLLGQLDDAKSTIDEIPRSRLASFVRLVIARYHIDRSDHLSAQKVLEGLPPPDDLYADQWLALKAKLKVASQEYEEGLRLLDEAIKLRPQESGHWHESATALRLLGRPGAGRPLATAQRIEEARRRLYELLESDALEDPSPSTCREAARLCRLAGKQREADSWELLAVKVSSRGARTSTPTPAYVKAPRR